MTHHHHHHYRHHPHAHFHDHQRRHRFHHLSSSQTDASGISSTHRARFLGVSIFTSSVIVLAAVAFMAIAFVQFFTNASFPKFLIIPFVAVPALMIVIAVVALVRTVRLYKTIQSNDIAEPSEEEPASPDDQVE